jgi:signal transduction histidine kinase
MHTGTLSTARARSGRILHLIYSISPTLIAVVLAAVGLGGTYVLYKKVQETEFTHLDRRTATEVHHVVLETESGVSARLRSLDRLAAWWVSQGPPLDPEDWQSDSGLLLPRPEGLLEAVWIDTGLRVLWSVEPGAIRVQGRREIPPEVLGRVPASGKAAGATICGPPRGGILFVCTAARSRSRVVGYVVGIYQTAPLLDSILDADLPPEYDVTVLAAGQPIYRHRALDEPLGTPRAALLTVPGEVWDLRLALPVSDSAGLHSFIALFGLAVTALLVIAARTAHTSARRAAQLSEANAALLEEERARRRTLADFQTLLDVVPIGIVVSYDPNGRTAWSNPASAAMLGVPRDLNVAMIGPDAGRIPYRILRNGVDVPVDELPLYRAVRDGTPVVEEEFDIVRGDGSVVKTLSYAAPLLDETGAVRGAVIAFVDITGQRRAEEERKLLMERLQRSEKLKSLAVMAGGIAHDFNNLLTTIMGRTALAYGEAPESGEIRTHLAESLATAERAALLVRQLLAYSGHPFHRLTMLDLPVLVREMGDEIRSYVPGAVAVEFHLEEAPPPILADAAELRDVIRNILSNSVEALAGEGAIEIRSASRELSAQQIETLFPYDSLVPGKYVCLEIRDSGCGMSPEVARSVFEPFFTTKFAGRGLGLSAAQGIVKAHGGGIRVETAQGQGTLVEMVFPCAPDAEITAPCAG